MRRRRRPPAGTSSGVRVETTIIKLGSENQSHFNKYVGANYAGERAVGLAGAADRARRRRAADLPAIAPAAAAGDPDPRTAGGRAHAVVAAPRGGARDRAQHRHAGLRAACARRLRELGDRARHVRRGQRARRDRRRAGGFPAGAAGAGAAGHARRGGGCRGGGRHRIRPHARARRRASFAVRARRAPRRRRGRVEAAGRRVHAGRARRVALSGARVDAAAQQVLAAAAPRALDLRTGRRPRAASISRCAC